MKNVGLLVLVLLAVSLVASAEDVTVPESYVAEESFPIALTSANGDEITVTVTRRKSVESIPFWVEYELFGLEEDAAIVWMLERPIPQQDPMTEEVEGRAARFVSPSNAWDHTVELRVDIGGELYQWQEILDFSLHSQTEVLLDASQFGNSEIASATWSASNGDPADEATFPITNASDPQALLVSQWPNVLTVSCEVEAEDGSKSKYETQALLYFRGGTPFAIRSVAATPTSSQSPETFGGIIDQMFPLLAGLGVNSITTSITWWFGPPDENGNWDVHPVYYPTNYPGDPRGNTITPEQLEKYFETARQFGFRVHVELRQQPYRNDSQLQQDYWDKYYPLRITDEFLYGDGEGYWNMLMHYLPLFTRYGEAAVFLNAECGGMETQGGSTTRQFFRDVIDAYREAGFTGAISYAAGIDLHPHQENFVPLACGIPWADMDYVAFTYYPHLATTNDASTQEMYLTAKQHVDQFFRPLSELYGKPVFVEDCYCIAFDGCAVNPLQFDPADSVDLEESRRYHTAVLRALAKANLTSQEPLIAGMTIADYGFSVDRYWGGSVVWTTAHPYLNVINGREALRLLIKVFYSDKPLAEG